MRVWDEGVGIFVYFGGDLSVRFHVGVATGLVLSPELCAQLAAINQENPMGTFYLSNEWAHDEFPAEWLVDDQEGQDSNIRDRLYALWNGTWILLYHVKVWKRWIEPTGVSEQIILDVLANIEVCVNRAVNYLNGHAATGITRWDPRSDESWMNLLSKI